MIDFFMCIIICFFFLYFVCNIFLIIFFVYVRIENGLMWVGFVFGELLFVEKNFNNMF